MSPTMRVRQCLIAVCLLAPGAVTRGMTYLPVTDASLVDRSPIAIIGRVATHEPRGEAYTSYRVLVERVLKGSLNTLDITVAVPGSDTFVVSGTPHFVDGDRVILFLVAHTDGTFRIVELMLGAFREVRVKDSLETRAQRDLTGSTSLGGPQAEPARDFETFATWIGDRARGEQGAGSYERPKADLVVDEAYGEWAPYTFLGSPARWAQFDSGGSVPWVIRLGGSTMAGGGVTALQTALNAYNAQPTSLLSFTYAGTNANAQSIYTTDGVNALLMNDPFEDIPLSFDCNAGGILARGGFSVTGATHYYKGSFHRTILEGNIVTQNGADCALVQLSGSFGAQVLAHELGHAIGLGHACGDAASGACVPGSPQDEALMRASAHGDARGAAFSSDDIAGLVRLYERPAVCGPGGSLDSDGDGIPNNLEPIEGTSACAKDNDVFTSERLFAMQQYRDFLGREGDSFGINYWMTAISGGTTRATVTKSFFDSAEFQGAIAPVTRLYYAYFNRIPDKPGLDYWIAAYRSGTSLNSVSESFAASAEFTGTYGSLNNSQFVTLVYQNVLGRAPDAAGLAYWKGQLDSFAMTRGQVMVGFSESGEYLQSSYNRVFVTMVYYGMLRRMPDPPGFAYWVAQLSGGASALNLINGFLAASEYHGRFLP